MAGNAGQARARDRRRRPCRRAPDDGAGTLARGGAVPALGAQPRDHLAAGSVSREELVSSLGGSRLHPRLSTCVRVPGHALLRFAASDSLRPAGRHIGAAERRITLIDEVLTGQRVRLRRVQPADEQALTRIFTDPEVARWWGDPSRSVRDVLHPEEGESCFMVEVGADLVGMIQYVEETDPMYEHAGI